MKSKKMSIMITDENKYNTKSRMNTILIIFGIVSMLIISVFFGFLIKYYFVESIEENAMSELKGTVEKLDTHNAASQNRNEQVISFAQFIIKERGGLNIIGQDWFVGGDLLNSNNTFSEDVISTTPKAQFAVYQKVGNDYVIISTSIKINGKYINGAKLEDASVKEFVEAGKTFYNRTLIQGAGFIAMYKPIMQDGKLVGMFCTGQEDGKVQRNVSIFGAQRFLPNGFTIWLKDPNFVFVVPDDKKKDWSKMPDNVYQEMKMHKDGEYHKMNFEYLNTDYEMVYIYDPNVYSYIQFIYPVSDKYLAVPGIVIPMVCAISVLILLLIIAFNRLINKVFNDVGGEPQYVKTLVDEIAEGDMTGSDGHKVDSSRGILKSAYTMAENLKSILSKIYDGANSMQNLSSQISGTTQTLSENAKYQAESADSIVEAITDISDEINQNAQKTSNAEKITNTVLTNIGKIKEAQDLSYNAVKGISEKIDIINDIAFQTNILALNAAVEAARAGEHGKGFAVVASEIQKLAEKSKHSAADIIECASASFNATANSSELIANIMPDVNACSALISEIGCSAENQKLKIQEIDTSVKHLNASMQGSAEACDDLAVSAEDLDSQAQNFRDSASVFKF